MPVGDDRYPPADQRQHAMPADQIRVTPVVGMHRHTRIAEHGLRPGGRHGQGNPVRTLDRVAEVPEAAVDLARLDLQVRDRRLQCGVPVHQALVLVDQPLPVQLDEHPRHGLRQALVHGEPFARPIRRGPQGPELPRDRPPGLGLPFPDPFEEPLPAEFGAPDPLLLEPAFDHHLRRDARMVRSGLPKRVPAPHPVVADQYVLEGEGQAVPHVQAAGDVRRRHHDRIGRGLGSGIGGEGPGPLPRLVPRRLERGGSVGLVEHPLRPGKGAAISLGDRDAKRARSPGGPAARRCPADARRATPSASA